MYDLVMGASNTTFFGCMFLNEPKVHKVGTHICNGLILWAMLNLLFIFQQDGRTLCSHSQ